MKASTLTLHKKTTIILTQVIVLGFESEAFVEMCSDNEAVMK